MRFQFFSVVVLVVFSLHFKSSEQQLATINWCAYQTLPTKELCDCLPVRREVFYKDQTKYFVEANVAVDNIADVEKCGPFPYNQIISTEQCGDTGYSKMVFFKNTTVVFLAQGVAVNDMQFVFGCYLIIGGG